MKAHTILYPPRKADGEAAFCLQADVPEFEGHFPGNPIAPGALLLHWMIETARAQGIAQPAQRITRVRFLHEVKPGDAITVRAESSRRGLKCEVTANGTVAATAVFPLPVS